MRFEPSDDQAMIAETFGRFLDENSSMARVRAAPAGFDAALWRGLAELGGLGIRVPEADGGVGLGVLDAVLVMEQAGANIADYVLMLTRTDPDAPKHKGLTMFIVR